MKCHFLSLVVMLSASVLFFSCNKESGDWEAWKQQADSCYMAGDYAGASDCYGHAIRCEGACTSTFYNAACCAAMAGDADEAFARLNKLYKRFPEWYSRHLDEDTDLESLHQDKRWAPFAQKVKERREAIESAYEHPLYDQLIAIAAEDQASRNAYMQAYMAQSPAVDSLYLEMTRLDTIHMQFVDSLIETRGWLDKDKIGDATSAVWLVVQHYGMDMWQKYLPIFREAVAKGDLNQQQLDMLEARIKQFSTEAE